jgi:transposase
MKNSTYTHVGKQDTLQNSLTQTQMTARPVVKLGVDWHAQEARVVRMVEGLTPQPAQRLSHTAFLNWVGKLLSGGSRVVAVYEGGPGGFHLHRQLTALGAECFVVSPERLDPRSKGVVNDATDARELVLKLDRYLSGNHRAMSLVRVPSLEEEQRRALGRQRQQLHKERQRLAAQGRSLCLTQGIRLLGPWWKKTPALPVWLKQRLAVWRQLILAVEEQLEALSQAVEELAPAVRPKGLGPLSLGLLEMEICSWNRFTNRKQMGSFAGLCGGVSSSGQSHCDLSITKAGHARLRWLLIEAAWRLVYYQPQCPAVQRWKRVLLRPGVHSRPRKRAIVAVARQLGVDLWRWRTGRVSAEQLGWIMV